MFSQDTVTGTRVQWSQKSHSGREGEGEGRKSQTVLQQEHLQRGNCEPQSQLSSSAHSHGEGGREETQTSRPASRMAGLSAHLSSTNKHSKLPGQTCFSARFQSSASERERKQEGWGLGARKRDECRRDGRGMRNLGQIRWESAQPLTRN